MLHLFDQSLTGNRHAGSRFGSRRHFLIVGSLLAGGLTLEQMCQAGATAGNGSLLRDKSVVFLFMHGGPSQFETFDPKMDAPVEIRSTTGEVQTNLPGVTFGGTFERLSTMADRLAIVRSFTTGDSRHDIKPIVHKSTNDANLGTLYSRIAGAHHPITGMPRNVALFPQAVAPEAQPTTMNFGKFGSSGNYSAALAPFAPGAGGNLQDDMQLSIPLRRLNDRRKLLTELDQLRWQRDRSDSASRQTPFRQQAFETILGGLADAFDLKQEDPRTLARYDTSPIARPENISKKWKNYQNYVDNGQTLGKLLLLSRRLCERGAGFVTITTNFVWDMHADVNNAGVAEGMRYMGRPFDHAVSAFLEDVHERGLSDKILLVCCGEMGRTPRINKNGGRDHWGNLAPLILAGGGLPMGQVIGESSRDGSVPKSKPITIENLVATILKTLVDPGILRLEPDVPREILQAASEWESIRELI